MRRAYALCVLLSAGCALAPLSSLPELPPRTTTAVPLDEDEARLWTMAERVERSIAETGRVRADPELEAYLLDVARRLHPPEVFEAVHFRVRVVRDAGVNAMILPNGAMYVTSGYLARMQSEAELAFVLAHEMSHAIHRHALKEVRHADGFFGRDDELMNLISAAYHSRAHERDADRDAFARMSAAGYDLGGARAALELLVEAREEGPALPAALHSHPDPGERIEAGRAVLTAARHEGARRDAEVFLERTAAARLDNARVELAAGRYDEARAQGRRVLDARPRDPASHVFLAEVERRDLRSGTREGALAGYRRALELDGGSADAWRGLGLVLAKAGDRDGARAALTRYLELAPEALDRAHIERALASETGGRP